MIQGRENNLFFPNGYPIDPTLLSCQVSLLHELQPLSYAGPHVRVGPYSRHVVDIAPNIHSHSGDH